MEPRSLILFITCLVLGSGLGDEEATFFDQFDAENNESNMTVLDIMMPELESEEIVEKNLSQDQVDIVFSKARQLLVTEHDNDRIDNTTYNQLQSKITAAKTWYRPLLEQAQNDSDKKQSLSRDYKKRIITIVLTILRPDFEDLELDESLDEFCEEFRDVCSQNKYKDEQSSSSPTSSVTPSLILTTLLNSSTTLNSTEGPNTTEESMEANVTSTTLAQDGNSTLASWLQPLSEMGLLESNESTTMSATTMAISSTSSTQSSSTNNPDSSSTLSLDQNSKEQATESNHSTTTSEKQESATTSLTSSEETEAEDMTTESLEAPSTPGVEAWNETNSNTEILDLLVNNTSDDSTAEIIDWMLGDDASLTSTENEVQRSETTTTITERITLASTLSTTPSTTIASSYAERHRNPFSIIFYQAKKMVTQTVKKISGFFKSLFS